MSDPTETRVRAAVNAISSAPELQALALPDFRVFQSVLWTEIRAAITEAKAAGRCEGLAEAAVMLRQLGDTFPDEARKGYHEWAAKRIEALAKGGGE